MLSNFKFWRRLRGGSWALVTGWFWGKRWIYIGKEAHHDAEEFYETLQLPWP